MKRLAFAGLLMLAGLLPLIPRGEACAIAWQPGTASPPTVADEAAIIAWNPQTKIETFIRKATFATSSADFGFIVPTPTLPALEVADGVAFASLASLTAARYEYVTETKYEFDLGLSCGMAAHDTFKSVGAALPGAAKEAVQVLNRQRVGGYEATSLMAESPAKLRAWLEKNQYQARPELEAWFKAYTEAKWVLTAFKIVGPASKTSASVNADTVKMTFATPRPFYPYREPTDARAGAGFARSLSVYFASDRRYDGTLGEAGEWPGRAVWSKPLPEVTAKFVGLPPGAYTLTEFTDRSSPRPGTDEVYFAPAKDQTAFERPPIIVKDVKVVKWPGEVGGIACLALIPIGGVGVAVLLLRLIRRKPAA